jgi:hypothetical protein
MRFMGPLVLGQALVEQAAPDMANGFVIREQARPFVVSHLMSPK